MWVRSEYAGELAVVSAWITALLPWSVSVVPEAYGMVVVRFVFFRVQYVTQVDLPEELARPLLFVYQVPEFHGAQSLEVASLVWVAGAVVVALAVALSIVYYSREERVEALPVDPVRLMGGIIGVAALLHTAATILFWQAQMTIPLGVVLMWIFAVTLLRVDRTESADAKPDAPTAKRT